MSRLQETSPAADRVVRKSRRYFDLAKEHKAAREAERHTLLLEGDDLKAWCDRTREMKSTEIGLAYSNPKSVEGAFEMLRLVRHRLDQLEDVLRLSDAHHLSKIIERSERALKKAVRRQNAN